MENSLVTIFSKYEGKRENVIPILQKVQEEYTYLPEDLMAEIAKYTRVPASDLYGVATFYAQFRFTPTGENFNFGLQGYRLPCPRCSEDFRRNHRSAWPAR